MLKIFFIRSFIFISAIMCVFCVTGCKEKTWSYNSAENKKAAEQHIAFTGIKSDFDKSNLPPLTNPFKVIDVSAWQEEVDFAKVKESGVKGVVLRLSRYNIDKDTYFDRNYTEAKKHGLLVGCYYFMGAQSTDEAIKEAQKVTKLLDEKKYELELPVFYDVEDEHDTEPGNISSLDRQVLTDIVKTFCETMSQNGYYAGYYSTIGFARQEYYPEQLSKYPFWVARWNESIAVPFTYSMWQYSATGQIPGVNGDCDVNLCFMDFHIYIKENGYNNLKK